MSGITMRDIGKKVGVSAVTVSKALAGKAGVSEEMRQKIVRIAAEMGYVNPLSVQNREKRALDVGILVPEHFFGKDSFYAMLQDRPYRHAYTVDEIIDIIKNEKDKSWNKKLVEDFIYVVKNEQLQ